MSEEYKIEIESTGGYELRKEFRTKIKLTERQYLALVTKILDYLDEILPVDE